MQLNRPSIGQGCLLLENEFEGISLGLDNFDIGKSAEEFEITKTIIELEINIVMLR